MLDSLDRIAYDKVLDALRRLSYKLAPESDLASWDRALYLLHVKFLILLFVLQCLGMDQVDKAALAKGMPDSSMSALNCRIFEFITAEKADFIARHFFINLIM